MLQEVKICALFSSGKFMPKVAEMCTRMNIFVVVLVELRLRV